MAEVKPRWMRRSQAPLTVACLDLDNDFPVAVSGLGGSPAVTAVTGSGTAYTVSASTGSGSGTLGLNLVGDDTIADAAGNPLGGPGTSGAGDGSTTGEVYTLDRPIASVRLLNGDSTAGTIDRHDVIVVRFSRDMQPSSFCATWIDVAGTFLGIAGDNQVTVTLTDRVCGTLFRH